MSSLPEAVKIKLETLLQMSGGYVLDFSNPRFYSFILNTASINANDAKYNTYGTSKAKVLRRIWDLENDITVGKLTEELLNALEALSAVDSQRFPINRKLFDDCLSTALTMQGKKSATISKEHSKDDFLKIEVGEVPIALLRLDSQVTIILERRIVEVKKCLANEASLAVIFLCGSILEGILLGIATGNSKLFNESNSSPKDTATGKVKQFHEWTLSNFIDVAYNINIIGLDVKKFSHALRDFRNYIHPFSQMSSGFNPDIDTAKISWQVLKAAMNDIKQNCN